MIRRFALPLCLATLALAPSAKATTLTLGQQGYLLGPDDAPVTESALPMTFRIFDRSTRESTETEHWTGSCAVRVENGFYAVTLGDGTCGNAIGAAAVSIEGSRFLEVSVRGMALSPRLRLGLVPNAAFALDAAKVGGLTVAELDARYVRNGGGPSGDVSIAGAVSAGSFAGDGSRLTKLDAASLASGTVDAQRLPATLAYTDRENTFTAPLTAPSFRGRGEALTHLDAANVASGRLSADRLPTTAALLDRDATFSGSVTAGSFTGDGAGLTNLTIPPLAISNAMLQDNAIALAKLAKGACKPGQVIRRATDDSAWTCSDLPRPEGPAAFSFTDQSDVTIGAEITSNSVTISGFTGPLTAICHNCAAQRNGTGDFLPVLSGFVPGDTIRLRANAPSKPSSTTSAAVSIGATLSAPWTIRSTSGIIYRLTSNGYPGGGLAVVKVVTPRTIVNSGAYASACAELGMTAYTTSNSNSFCTSGGSAYPVRVTNCNMGTFETYSFVDSVPELGTSRVYWISAHDGGNLGLEWNTVGPCSPGTAPGSCGGGSDGLQHAKNPIYGANYNLKNVSLTTSDYIVCAY